MICDQLTRLLSVVKLRTHERLAFLLQLLRWNYSSGRTWFITQ